MINSSANEGKRWDGWRWVPVDEAKTVHNVPVQGPQSERKIYVGNIPPGTTEVNLKQFCKSSSTILHVCDK